jgi:hypothetical protein
MYHGPESRGTRSMWRGIIVLLTAVPLASAGPSDARGGHHGGGGHHGVRGHHGFRHPHVFVGVVPFGIAPFWSPNWPPYDDLPYGYPLIMIPPAPPPPPSWYACDDPLGYYPYVQQCPGGWRPVPMTPPEGASQRPPAGTPPDPTARPPPSWYACDTPPGYYPYVHQCPSGWRPVAPTPP